MGLSPVDPNQEPGLLPNREVLEAGDRPAGDDEGVAWGDWELIGDDGKQIIEGLEAHRFDFAKGGQ